MQVAVGLGRKARGDTAAVAARGQILGDDGANEVEQLLIIVVEQVAQPSWRVIVADDHADTRDLYGAVLALMHFDVRTAANGADALALAQELPPHVVVADLRMPQMNGYELLDALRADSRTQHVPVIATSASLGEEARALAQGFEAFCPKPCDPQRLTLAVVSVLLKHADAVAPVENELTPVQVRGSADGQWWGVWHGHRLISRWTSEFSARDAARVFSEISNVPLDLVPLAGHRSEKG